MGAARRGLRWLFSSVVGRMAALLLLLGGLFAASTYVTFQHLEQQEADGRVINLAGRQRMLLKQMSVEWHAVERGSIEMVPALSATAAEYDAVLRNLQQGSTARSIPGPPDGVEDDLALLATMWAPAFEDIQLLQTASPDSVRFAMLLGNIRASAPALLVATENVVSAYEEEFTAEVATLQRTVIILGVVGMVIAGAGWWFVLARLARPLGALAEGASRLRRGDLDFRLDIDAGDEVGLAAREFNAMAGQLQTMHRALTARAGELEESAALLEDANRALRDSEEFSRAVLGSLTAHIAVLDRDGVIVAVNEAWERFARENAGPGWATGVGVNYLDVCRSASGKGARYAQAALAGIGEVLDGARPSYTLEYPIHARSAKRWFMLVATPLASAQGGAVLSHIDITERKQAEEVLREHARRDPLTSLLNHRGVTEELRRLVSRPRETTRFAVAMIDVDGMKAVNDTYGHQAGDAVLVATGQALSVDGAVVGRYGGDEFIAILRGAGREEAEGYRRAVSEELTKIALKDPESGARIPVAATVGLAVYPEEADSVTDLIKLSDSALYAARRQRPVTAGALSPTPRLGSERAAQMVGELVPLLTSPGRLDDKLRMVAHRLSVGAGYDAVNFRMFDSGDAWDRAQTTFARLPDELTEAWTAEQRRTLDDTPIIRALAETRRPVILDDPAHDERLTEEQRRLLRAAGMRSALAAPMLWEGQLVGMLSIASRQEAAFGPRDAQFLLTVAIQVTSIVRTASLVDQLQSTSERLERAREETVMMLAAAAEARDHVTGRHLQNLRALTELLAREMGYDAGQAAQLGLASVLHDIGKLRVPDDVLASTGKLTPEAWDVMKRHTIWGSELLAGRQGFELAEAVARCHHERWDGGGYPRGLREEEIPEAATIVAVADAFDAMTSARPYRAGMSSGEAVREIVAHAGTQFNPRVAQALSRLYERGELTRSLPVEEGEARAA